MTTRFTCSLVSSFVLSLALTGCSTKGDGPVEEASQQSSGGLRPVDSQPADSQSTASAENGQGPVSDMAPPQIADTGLRSSQTSPQQLVDNSLEKQTPLEPAYREPETQTAAISSPMPFETNTAADSDENSRLDDRRGALDADDDRPRRNTYPYRRHRPLRVGVRSVGVAPPMFTSPFVDVTPTLAGLGGASGLAGEEGALGGEGLAEEMSEMAGGSLPGTIDLVGSGADFGFDDFGAPGGFGELPVTPDFGPDGYGYEPPAMDFPDGGNEFDGTGDDLADAFDDFFPDGPFLPDGPPTGGPNGPGPQPGPPGDTPKPPPDDGGLDPGQPVPPPDF